MSNEQTSFGRRALQAQSINALLELENQEKRADSFAVLDSLITSLFIRSLRGERIISMTENEVYENSLTIEGLSSEQREFLSSYHLAQQQSKGAWFLPEKISLAGGIANFPSYVTQGFKFPHALASLQRGKVPLKDSAEAIFFWGVLAPLFERLVYPFELRGRLSGTLPPEDEAAAWSEVELFLESLGFHQTTELSVLRSKWKDLPDAASQLNAKRELLRALERSADSRIGSRYRLFMFRPLIEQYYKKSKADGRVKRKQALTKPFQTTLSGFFQGDWLGLLTYLGEQPHAEEQIVTALPKTPLRVRGTSRAAEIAASHGIPTEEVERIAAALWQESEGTSPVESRITTLKRFWDAFDDIHAKQETGMKSLWGLVEEPGSVAFERNPDSPYQPSLYREILPRELNDEIESLWGNIMLTKWPNRIVTEPFPHRLMAETFGPAIFFWQSCALTAWFICEGPYSRTDMSGLAHHQRRELHELKQMQTPVAEQLFKDLVDGENRLGPEETIPGNESTREVGLGISITISTSAGTRRKGFEILRDIITRHRRSWANQYLDPYLRSRWESEITNAAKAFNLLLGEKGGKAPTLKQFARSAAAATNHWFKGNISGLYRTIGEKSPVEPVQSVLMPKDKINFVRRVLGSLPSLEFQMYEGRVSDNTAQDYYRKELAELAIKYVQLEEALDRPPEMKELGEKFLYRSNVLSADQGEAWRIYSNALESARKAMK